MTQFTDDIVRRGQFLKLGFARKWLEQQKRCVWQNNGQPACQFTEESGASNGDGHGKQANTQRGEDGRSQCAHNQGDAMVCPPLPPTKGTMMPTLPTVPTLPTPTRAIYVGHEFRSPCDLCNALPARTSESSSWVQVSPTKSSFQKNPDQTFSFSREVIF